MQPDDVFLEAISFDHFDHRALYGHTPTQFCYDWCAPPPPLPESLVAYNRHNNRSSISFVHDLLSIPVALSSIDRVCTKLVELLVTRCMAELVLDLMFASSKMSPTAIISHKACSSSHYHSSILPLDHQFPHCRVLHEAISAISFGSARVCVWVSPRISTTTTTTSRFLSVTWPIMLIQHWIKWTPLMALHALSFTVLSFEWIKMSWVHYSPIHQHCISCLPSTQRRCLPRVLKPCQG